MVAVDVAVATRPDEVTHVQIALLRHHVREQRIAGNVERHTQKDVGTALVELAAQRAAPTGLLRRGHVELEERVAGHQRHLAEVGHVPGADDDAPGIGIGFERLDHIADLVDVPAVRRGPAAPLHAVHGAQLAVLACPFVPDRHAALFEPVVVARTREEPQQLNDDGFEVHLLGGDQRKAFTQIKPHLMAENALGAGAGAVGLLHAMGEHQPHEVFVLRPDGALQCGGGRLVHGGSQGETAHGRGRAKRAILSGLAPAR